MASSGEVIFLADALLIVKRGVYKAQSRFSPAQALERTEHNKAQAAKLLNISYDVLRYQVKKLGLE